MDKFIWWLQSRLTAHGYACGGIDGVFGPATQTALIAFQNGRSLAPTGKADDATVEALKASSSIISPRVKSQIPDRDTIAATGHPVAGPWPRQRDCMSFYGDVGQNQTHIEVPFDMFLAWQKSTRISRITLHEKVAASAQRVFEVIAKQYSAQEREDLGINLFGGSLNVRRMRGGSSYSMHSWGIAIDFDPERNGLHVHKPDARLSHADAVPFWDAWAAEGWLSLGRARNFDWMHVQAARL